MSLREALLWYLEPDGPLGSGKGTSGARVEHAAEGWGHSVVAIEEHEIALARRSGKRRGSRIPPIERGVECRNPGSRRILDNAERVGHPLMGICRSCEGAVAA